MLIFDSNFEGGNLKTVLAKSETEYDLTVFSDTNTSAKCQWFYFMVSCTKKNLTVKFNILNLTKSPHFIKEGIKPLVLSEKENQVSASAWTSKTDKIQVSRTQNQIKLKGERSI